MSAVTLKAHFDGRHLVLDEPASLPIDTPLAVTISPVPTSLESVAERADWAARSAQVLSRAYGDEEPEYTVSDLKT